MDLKQAFDRAAEDVLELKTAPDNSAKLQLYALFKQATKGNASGTRPGMFDMVNRAKYDAWAKLTGTSNEEAMQQYIDLVKRLQTI